ncbi:MAG: hypothetical protein V2A54_10245 [Bacteroidota bacterium]
MSTPKKPQPKRKPQPQTPYKKVAVKSPAKGGVKEPLFQRLEKWFERNDKNLFYILCGLCILFSFLLFNARISEGGDDSSYVEGGYNFAKNFTGYYYSFNAPFYPMFLSIPIAMFGLKIILLKALSVIFNFFSFYFFYKAFRKRIPYFVLYPVLFIIAINSSLLYYASQTYNEAFFMFFQSLMFLAVSYLITAMEKSGLNLKATMRQWLMVGLLIFILSMSKNIAIVALGSLIIYLIFIKKYKAILYAIGAFLVFKIPFEILKKLIWGSIGQYGSQSKILLQKHPYDATQGQEDLFGFFGRFYDNTLLYFSKRFFQIMGVSPETAKETSGFVALIVIVLLLIGLWRILKSKNRILLYTVLYSAAMIAGSFFILQAAWDQPRIILIFVPLMLLIILFGIYDLLAKSSGAAQTIYLYIIIGITIPGLLKTFNKSSENVPILSKNLGGNLYYGYTPDWENYLRMSEWCGKNLKDPSYVACRKGSMSFIYSGGKAFFNVPKVRPEPKVKDTNPDPDSVLNYLKQNKVTHVILASIRVNPTMASTPKGGYINTLHRMLGPIAQKYPQKLKMVHQEGDNLNEPAYLYEILYNK